MKASARCGAHEASIIAFVDRARRRHLTRELLGAALVSGAADIALGHALALANRSFGFDLPGADFGLVLFAVLAALSLRRNRAGRVAPRTDRRLGLQDRLVTFLDFRERRDVDPDFRVAQARESAAAISRADLVRGVPVPRLLWAAPLVFCWMLYVDYFPFFVPFFQPLVRFSVVVPGPGRERAGTPQAPDGDAARPKPAAETPRTDRAEREPEPAANAPDDAPAADEAKKPSEGQQPPPPGQGPTGAGDAGPRVANVPAIISEPARLYSDPVGRGLTPVAQSAPGPGAAALETPLRGRISFSLVPVDGAVAGPEGRGSKPGGGKAEGLAVTVDYDAIPPEYRAHVRRYFNALIKLFEGGPHGT